MRWKRLVWSELQFVEAVGGTEVAMGPAAEVTAEVPLFAGGPSPP